jgi:phosphoserine phosphatase RsbU/P
MRILIAEDDATSRTILRAVLSKGGYDVVSRDDGLEALEAFKQPDAPDLAIVDLIMPKLDGLELLREVRAMQTSRPPYIIILSTKGETTDVVAGLDAGADDYLVKPFDAAELRARVEVGRRMIEMRAVLADKVQELAQALEQVKTLRGIVPICANCKNVRDDQGYWNRVETYVREHTLAEFSHAVCPDCMIKLYPQFEERGDPPPKRR